MMDWIRPKFSESQVPPRKRQRLDGLLSKSNSQPNFTHPTSLEQHKGSSWIDKYKPNSKSDLIVHKKKVEEVESWLQSLGGEGSKILLLTGSPGSGKLTTLKVLCKGLKVQISEWITPPAQEYDPENFSGSYCSQQRMFEEFLIRASRYGSVLTSSAFRRIIVVKDIPNVFIRDPPLFHELLLKFNQSQDLSVVFILTENSLILDMFPESIKQSLKIVTINFNPFTKKSTSTILSNIVRKEKCASSIETNVVNDIVETCDGDLRNAIMSLNFVSTKGVNFKITSKKTKHKTNSAKDDSMKPFLTDPSLDLFHGLGRVLYVKRNEAGTLAHDPNSIVDSFTTTTNSFINMLQENYLSIYSDILSVSKASNYLAVSDFILHDTNDTLISRDVSLSIATRGLMDTNRMPIKKFQQFSKSKTSKATDLTKSYNDCIKANFCSSNPKTILLDSITYLNKMSKSLDNEAQKNVVKELTCFYLMDKHF